MAKKIIIELDIDADGAVSGLNQVDKGAKQASEGLNDAEKAADKFTGGAISGLKSLRNGIKGAVKGIKTLKVSLASTGIGLLVVAFGSLVAFFTKTERGAQALRVVTASLEAAFGSLTDVAVALGEGLFNAIKNPQQAIEDLGDSISYYFTEFIPNAISKVMEGFGLLGQAIGELIDGNFEGAFDKAAEGVLKLGDGFIELNPSTAIVKQLATGVAELGEEIANDVKQAGDLERRLNALIVAERNLSVETANRRAEIKELNQIAEDTTRPEQERIEAAKKAISIEQSLLNQRVANAKERLAIIREQNALGESNDEDKQKEADAEIALAQIRQESLELQTTLTNKLNTIEQQAQAQREAQAMAALEKRKEQEEIAIAQQKMLDDLRIQQIADREQQELALVGQKYDELFSKAQGNAELEKELISAQEREMAAIKKKFRDEEKAEIDKNDKEQEQIAIAQQKMLDDLRIQQIADREQQELALVGQKYDELFIKAQGNAELEKELISAQEREIAAIKEKFRKEEESKNKQSIDNQKKLDKAQADSKIAIASSAVSLVSDLIGKESAAAKSAAVALATINTYQAATNALATTPGPPPVPQIAAGLAVAAGLAQVRKILSTSIPSGGGGGGGASSAGAAAAAPPSFNVVGDSGQNQLSQAINESNREPTKAYVVSSEVSSAQQLDRLTKNNARF